MYNDRCLSDCTAVPCFLSTWFHCCVWIVVFLISQLWFDVILILISLLFYNRYWLDFLLVMFVKKYFKLQNLVKADNLVIHNCTIVVVFVYSLVSLLNKCSFLKLILLNRVMVIVFLITILKYKQWALSF